MKVGLKITAGGGCERVGGNCQKYLKRGWNRKKARGNKDFKNGGRRAVSRGRYLEKEGWNPLTN